MAPDALVAAAAEHVQQLRGDDQEACGARVRWREGPAVDGELSRPVLRQALEVRAVAEDRAHVHVMLHKALHDAVRKSFISTNPAEAADPPSIKKADRSEMSIWTPEQVRTFFDGIAKHHLAAGYILSAITG
jgi:hypothetical protein